MKAEAPWQSLPVTAPKADREEWEPVPFTNSNMFSMWQQQMQLMESFHNDMVMMVQMFVAMHREHQATVRDELDRVQQLTQELTRLNARLGQLPAPGTAPPRSETSRNARKTEPAPGAGSPKPESSPRAARSTLHRGGSSEAPGTD